jgi:hypothetical protein
LRYGGTLLDEWGRGGEGRAFLDQWGDEREGFVGGTFDLSLGPLIRSKRPDHIVGAERVFSFVH